METYLIIIIPLLLGYVLDLVIGDLPDIPRAERLFEKLIYLSEPYLNSGRGRLLKGLLLTLLFCSGVYSLSFILTNLLLSYSAPMYLIVATLSVLLTLSIRASITEGRAVFDALQKKGLPDGRDQLAKIVKIDTAQLTVNQVRILTIQFMSNSLSTRVVGPLFFYFIAGVPGMLTYKMVNTLNTAIGHRDARYENFGKFAASLADAVQFIPARITAAMIIIVGLSKKAFRFVIKYGHMHRNLNAGYPQAALAGLLNIRFGGPYRINGVWFEELYIGLNDRTVRHEEFRIVSSIHHSVCFLMVTFIIFYFFHP